MAPYLSVATPFTVVAGCVMAGARARVATGVAATVGAAVGVGVAAGVAVGVGVGDGLGSTSVLFKRLSQTSR